MGPKGSHKNKHAQEMWSFSLAPHLGAHNIAARFLRSGNFGAENFAAPFSLAIISVLSISSGGFLIAE